MSPLADELRAIRDEALDSGERLARDPGPTERERLAVRARELYERLVELQPQVDAAPPPARHDLGRTWSNARLDLFYVLSDGTGPTSLELGRRLA